LTLSSQTLLNKDRQCCESWRDVELGARDVCAVVDTTDEDRWVDLLCCPLHCDTADSCLTNDSSPHSVRVPTATTTDAGRPLPVLRRQQSVPSVSSTTQLFQRVYCSPLAASRQLHLFGDILCFILCYRLLFIIVPLSISLDTVLSHNYRITPVIGFKAVCS